MSDGYVTVAQCVEGLPLGRFVWEMLICAWLAWFLLGAINESTPLSFSFVSTEWAMTEQCALAMSAALAVGNFLSIILAGWVADRAGRLMVIQMALVMTAACGMLLQTARTFPQAVAARLVLGLVSGGLLSTVPPLIAELLPSRSRGFYLTIWCCGWPAGSLFAIGIGFLLPGVNWRTFDTVMLMPAVMLYVCTRADMLIESPRYLYLAGRREEGYNALMDMYEKEEIPLPWATETIAITTAPPRPTPEGKRFAASHLGVALWLALAMFAASAAAQSMKLWMPTLLLAQEADITAENGAEVPPGTDASRITDFDFANGPHAMSFLSLVRAPLMMAVPDYTVMRILAEGYIIEIMGIVACAYLSDWVFRRQMIQWALLAASALTLLALAAAAGGWTRLCGPILGLQLAAQACGLNFLQAFACEHFPTSRRAKATAFVIFVAQLGNLAIPAIGGLIVHHFSASYAVVFFSSLYLVSWGATCRLPLPSSPETPLHDVDEAAVMRESASHARKRAWNNYQTL
mmetsp:Transcript_42403/g.92385  ORF Transcript_42403/g.92385 Transcript_42403/m.92385 type:complete len:518 (+) Transcript_42403:168-1721(+)